jgi:hypothetical protein
MKPEVIDYKGQEVAIYDIPKTDEWEPRCSIDVAGEGLWAGKEKAIIVLLPQHSNETPTVINIGLTQHEITKSIDILNHARKCGDQDAGNVKSILREVRLPQVETLQAEI